MGGTDDPSNLVEVTVEEHAELHKQLWEDLGNMEDYIAWQGLAKLVPKVELVKMAMLHGSKKGNLISNAKRKGIKYKPRTDGYKGLGTAGRKWYHNPDDATQKGCFLSEEDVPVGWIRGQGKKAINPGLNFHAKKVSL